MRELGKVVVCIPARAGSKRVVAKNLRDFCGRLSLSIENAKQVFNLDEIYVNSDSDEMLALAKIMGVQSFKRDPHLASDTASGDEFMYDFWSKICSDTCVMLNPVCPLINADDVRRAITEYQTSACDTLISCSSTKMQVFCDDKPVNIQLDKKLEATQNNPIVSVLNWAITIWNTESFLERFRKNGHAYIEKTVSCLN